MTRVFGLVGSPVAHSLSPRMHGAWIAEAGLDATYLPFETPPDSTGEAILDALTTLGIAGANLTVPFKIRVIPHLAALDAVARRTGAVNTVVARDGRWIGSNTDAPGFAAAVEETGHSLKDAHVVVLGAGGAGRAVAVGAADAGATRVTLLNRTRARALHVAEDLNVACPATEVEGGALSEFDRLGSGAGVFVTAVSGPGREAIAALDPQVVRPDALWMDLNYWDRAPPLFEILQRRGVDVSDGLAMLIHQGALAFEAFTGAAADPSVARRVLGGGMGR